MESNYIYILFPIMLTITLVAFIMTCCDLMQPCNLFNITMTISAFFALLNVDRWNLIVGLPCLLVAVVGLMSFTIGGAYTHFVMEKSTCFFPCQNQKAKQHTDVKLLWIVIFSVIAIVLLYFNFIEIYRASIELGNTQGVSNMIKTVRYPIERGEVQFSRWRTYGFLFAQCLAYVSMFKFLQIYFNRKCIMLRYLTLVVLYIPFTILTTGRMELLCLMVYVFCLTSILYFKKNNYSAQAIVRVCFCSFVVFLGFVTLFLVYGFFSGKVASGDRTPFVILSHYAGLSFPALDAWLDQKFLENTYYGGSTLSGIYNNLRALGVEVPKVITFLEFTRFDGIDTNVYSAFRRYIYDYGYIGMVCILMIFGSLFTVCYEIIKKIDSYNVLTIMYCAFAWTLVMSFHDEKFLMNILNTQFIYKLLLISLFVYIFELKGVHSDHEKNY